MVNERHHSDKSIVSAWVRLIFPTSKAVLLALILILSGFITLESIKINGSSHLPRDSEVGRVLVIANRNSPVSLRVAQYYQQRRRIPTANFVALDLPDSSLTPGLESISYSTYQTRLDGDSEGEARALFDRALTPRPSLTGTVLIL